MTWPFRSTAHDRPTPAYYYDWSQIDEAYRDKGVFPVIPEAGLHATLGILARNVE
ncbi:hypothetical protein ABGB12_20635 [Actinocorallia sp. B10E7]|uniref:hypothetical protein n=1 Tax=Actinocorallia sp. B10E7 TaxID=3153558 RepID=UPI00325CA866